LKSNEEKNNAELIGSQGDAQKEIGGYYQQILN
jgi:hypothetical protein